MGLKIWHKKSCWNHKDPEKASFLVIIAFRTVTRQCSFNFAHTFYASVMVL